MKLDLSLNIYLRGLLKYHEIGASKGTVRTSRKLLKLWPYKTSYVPSAVMLRSVNGPMFNAETIGTVGHYRHLGSDKWRKTLWTFPTWFSNCTKCQTFCKNLQQTGKKVVSCGLWPLHSPKIFPCYLFLWWCLKEPIHTWKNSKEIK